jgi:hypothetical protein
MEIGIVHAVEPGEHSAMGCRNATGLQGLNGSPAGVAPGRHQPFAPRGGFAAAPGHHLGAFALSRIEQFAEARFGILDRPDRHRPSRLTSALTSLKAAGGDASSTGKQRTCCVPPAMQHALRLEDLEARLEA